MKTLLYYCLLGAVCFFAACKKDPQLKKTQTPAQITDSLSYTINGKTYVLTLPAGGEYGTSPSNKVYDPATGRTSTDADSTMFFTQYSFQSDRKNPNDTLYLAGIYFFKKYALKDMTTATPVNSPVDQSALYATGNHILATDFMRTSSTNGVAIDIVRVGSTYSSAFANEPTTVTQDKQANSSFEITSFIPINATSYWLEAKFNAALFNTNTEQPTALTNGFVRMKVQYRPIPN